MLPSHCLLFGVIGSFRVASPPTLLWLLVATVPVSTSEVSLLSLNRSRLDRPCAHCVPKCNYSHALSAWQRQAATDLPSREPGYHSALLMPLSNCSS